MSACQATSHSKQNALWQASHSTQPKAVGCGCAELDDRWFWPLGLHSNAEQSLKGQKRRSESGMAASICLLDRISRIFEFKRSDNWEKEMTVWHPT